MATLKTWRLLHKLRCSTTRITSFVQAVLTLHLACSNQSLWRTPARDPRVRGKASRSRDRDRGGQDGYISLETKHQKCCSGVSIAIFLG